jgi:hypothetical protein
MAEGVTAVICLVPSARVRFFHNNAAYLARGAFTCPRLSGYILISDMDKNRGRQ